MLLDQLVPEWDFGERHSRPAGEPRDVLLRAARDVTWREVPILRALVFDRFGSGRIDPDASVVSGFLDAGFRVLAEDSGEVVLGALSRTPGSLGTPPVGLVGDDFRRYDAPGAVKIALNLAAVDGRMTTETRVRATDPRSRRYFTAYWLLIRLPSGLIRRALLRAIVRRAGTPAADQVPGGEW